MRRIWSALAVLMLLAAPAAASDGRQAASAAAEAARALQLQAARIAASGGILKIARGKAEDKETADHLRAIEAALASAKS
jgi:hypothetical protein